MSDEIETPEMIHKAFSADVSVGEGDRSVTAKISTAAVDRDGEVLVPMGCNTKDFEKNPVVFLNHNYFDLPVGKCVAIKRTDEAIVAKTVFAERPADYPADKEWVPDTLLSLFKQGVVKGFSVGFTPIEVRPATEKDAAKYGKGVNRVFGKWNMLEYSVAPLPANQEAVATAVSKGMLSKESAKGLFNLEVETVDVQNHGEAEPRQIVSKITSVEPEQKEHTPAKVRKTIRYICEIDRTFANQLVKSTARAVGKLA